MSPSAVASSVPRDASQVFLAARRLPLWAGAGAVQLFTRVAVTLRAFCTSASDLPAAIASLICLHETVAPAIRFCAADAGQPTSTTVAAADTTIPPLRFTCAPPLS